MSVSARPPTPSSQSRPDAFDPREGDGAGRAPVSIIISTFNAARDIGACLDSIRTQTLLPLEVLVMDGGSSDGTAEIALSHGGALNLKVLAERDHGVYDAMNKGVAAATSDWIYFLGADDALFDTRVLASIAPRLTSDDDVVYGNALITGTRESVLGGPFDAERLAAQNICHQAMFYRRRSLLAAGGFNLAYPVLADWDLNIRLWRTACFRHVDRVIARYRAGGLSYRVHDEAFYRDHDRRVVRNLSLPAASPYYRGRMRRTWAALGDATQTGDTALRNTYLRIVLRQLPAGLVRVARRRLGAAIRPL